MIAKRVREFCHNKPATVLEGTLRAVYPLGELQFVDGGVAIYSTGVPVTNGGPDLIIETGMYVDDGGMMQIYVSHLSLGKSTDGLLAAAQKLGAGFANMLSISRKGSRLEIVFANTASAEKLTELLLVFQDAHFER
jgi:hypothetical protein